MTMTTRHGKRIVHAGPMSSSKMKKLSEVYEAEEKVQQVRSRLKQRRRGRSQSCNEGTSEDNADHEKPHGEADGLRDKERSDLRHEIDDLSTYRFEGQTSSESKGKMLKTAKKLTRIVLGIHGAEERRNEDAVVEKPPQLCEQSQLNDVVKLVAEDDAGSRVSGVHQPVVFHMIEDFWIDIGCGPDSDLERCRELYSNESDSTTS